MNSTPIPSNLWTERYEALRRYLVDDRKLLAAEPLSLSLLLHTGLTGWMRAWHSGLAADPAPSGCFHLPSMESPRWPRLATGTHQAYRPHDRSTA